MPLCRLFVGGCGCHHVPLRPRGARGEQLPCAEVLVGDCGKLPGPSERCVPILTYTMNQYPYGYHEPVDNLDFTFEEVGHDLNTLRFYARPEGDPVAAFTFEIKHTVPTLTVQLKREIVWRSLYPELKGPDRCLIHFGPDHDMGRFAYGVIAEQYMREFLRRPNYSSSSIYFTAQNEREYKWKQAGNLLECIDTHDKKWVAQYDTSYSPPQMRIKGVGVLICTEIFVTWFLYQNAKRWKWEIKIEKERKEQRIDPPLQEEEWKQEAEWL